MTFVIDSVLETYLSVYKDLIEVERIGRSVTLSFPFHLASNHRIEITVTDFGKDMCIISDSARTLGEIQAAGYSLSGQMKNRLERTASVAGLRITDGHLVLETSYAEVGRSIQKFLEVSKMIGDVYLVHRHREPRNDEIVAEVRGILQANKLHYKINQRIDGELESHPFDVLVNPNGAPGLAVAVLSGTNTHTVAQVWGFKCDDIKKGAWHKKTHSKLALVYDVRSQPWSEASKAILESRADIAIPSSSVKELPKRLH